MNKNIIATLLAVTAVGSGSAFAGVCQGTSTSWTALQTTCGAYFLEAQGLNAGGGFDKGLRAKRLSGTLGAGARGVNSSGQGLPICTVTDTKLDSNSAYIFSDACDPGVRYSYQVTF